MEFHEYVFAFLFMAAIVVLTAIGRMFSEKGTLWVIEGGLLYLAYLIWEQDGLGMAVMGFASVQVLVAMLWVFSDELF